MKRAGLIIFLCIGFVVMFDKVIMPFYISQGSVEIVPDVLNMDYEDASERLRRAGFEAIKSYHVKYLSNVDSNIVLSQMPESGSEVKPGRKVYLVVNKQEKPTFPMPDLMGRPEFDALQTAGRMEMVVQDIQISTVTNPELDGRVLSQSIPAQTIVQSGSSVSLIIGKYEMQAEGTTKITVPDVLGMSLVQAQQIIANAGLQMGRVTTEYSARLVPNTVISQRPGVGSFVSPDQPVSLTVVIMVE
jgi:eukaryotic-like serine/threonine-protein kinase